MTVITTVDPDHTRLQLRGYGMRLCDIFGEDGGRETVTGVVGLLDDFGLGGEGGDGDDGAEDLFAHDGHLFRDVGEDGGFDEVAFRRGGR